MKKQEIDELISIIANEYRPVVIQASDKLINNHDDYTIDSLIGLLESPKVDTRDATALALREIGSQKALEPLLRAIKKPENQNYNDTMVYALETLDCSHHFLAIFELAFEIWSIRHSAITILNEQEFWLYHEDLVKAREMLDFYIKNHPKEPEPDKELVDFLEELLQDLEEAEREAQRS